MQALADSTHNARCIHAMRVVQGYGKPLANRTIAGILQVCRNANPSNRQLFTYRLTLKQRSVQSDVLSVEEIAMVLRDMKEQEQWFYPLFLLWLSTLSIGLLAPGVAQRWDRSQRRTDAGRKHNGEDPE
jgi:integrase